MAANVTATRTYPCPYCKVNYLSISELQVHVRTHVQPQTFKCSLCEKTFLSKVKLQQHSKSHQEYVKEKLFRCPHCPHLTYFSTEESLGVHIKSHNIQERKTAPQAPEETINYDQSSNELISESGKSTTKRHGEHLGTPKISEAKPAKVAKKNKMPELSSISLKQVIVESEKNIKRRDSGTNTAMYIPKRVPDKKTPAGNLSEGQERPLDNKDRRLNSIQSTFHCPYCNKTSKANSDMIKHIRTHTRQKPFSCQYCNLKFSTNSQWRKHERKHTGETCAKKAKKTFNCNECDGRFEFWSELKQHKQKHEVNKMLKCLDTESKSKGSPEKTLTDNRELSENATDVDDMFSCELPEDSDTLRNDSVEKPSVPSGSEDVPEIHKCSYSTKKLKNAEEDIVDVESIDDVANHSGKLYNCDQCDEDFQQAWVLMEHIRTHSEEKHNVCSYCHKEFPSQEYLNEHVKNFHTFEKIFNCCVCKANFSTPEDFKDHVKIHPGISSKQFVCTFCEKAIRGPPNIIRHVRRHTGERPFVCLICEQKFTRKDALAVHVRVKHDTCPFVCSCGKTFLKMWQMNIHRRSSECLTMVKGKGEDGSKSEAESDQASINDTEEKTSASSSSVTERKSQKCQFCPKKFTSRQCLNRHKKWHCKGNKAGNRNEESRLHCPSCFKRFSAPNCLNKHIRKSCKGVPEVDNNEKETKSVNGKSGNEGKKGDKSIKNTCFNCLMEFSEFDQFINHRSHCSENSENVSKGSFDLTNKAEPQESKTTRNIKTDNHKILCPGCFKEISTQKGLMKHQRWHCKGIPLEISDAKRKSPALKDNLNESKKLKTENNSGKLVCIYCSKTMRDKATLNKHQRWHCKGIPDSEISPRKKVESPAKIMQTTQEESHTPVARQVTCPHCFMKFCGNKELIEHQRWLCRGNTVMKFSRNLNLSETASEETSFINCNNEKSEGGNDCLEEDADTPSLIEHSSDNGSDRRDLQKALVSANVIESVNKVYESTEPGNELDKKDIPTDMCDEEMSFTDFEVQSASPFEIFPSDFSSKVPSLPVQEKSTVDSEPTINSSSREFPLKISESTSDLKSASTTCVSDVNFPGIHEAERTPDEDTTPLIFTKDKENNLVLSSESGSGYCEERSFFDKIKHLLSLSVAGSEMCPNSEVDSTSSCNSEKESSVHGSSSSRNSLIDDSKKQSNIEKSDVLSCFYEDCISSDCANIDKDQCTFSQNNPDSLTLAAVTHTKKDCSKEEFEHSSTLDEGSNLTDQLEDYLPLPSESVDCLPEIGISVDLSKGREHEGTHESVCHLRGDDDVYPATTSPVSDDHSSSGDQTNAEDTFHASGGNLEVHRNPCSELSNLEYTSNSSSNTQTCSTIDRYQETVLVDGSVSPDPPFMKDDGKTYTDENQLTYTPFQEIPVDVVGPSSLSATYSDDEGSTDIACSTPCSSKSFLESCLDSPFNSVSDEKTILTNQSSNEIPLQVTETVVAEGANSVVKTDDRGLSELQKKEDLTDQSESTSSSPSLSDKSSSSQSSESFPVDLRRWDKQMKQIMDVVQFFKKKPFKKPYKLRKK